MIDNKTVSVIIPVFNSEKTLPTCLDSIIYQSYENLEIICINDGSTDSSLQILEAYGRRDSRIQILTQDNKGPSSARNQGLSVATGKYVSFIDSDDSIDIDAYKKLFALAEEENADIVMFGGYVHGYADGWVHDLMKPEDRMYDETNIGYVLFHEKVARPFLWLHFIKRDLFISPEVLWFDEDIELGEDQLMQFQYISRAKRIRVTDKRFYHYNCENDNSLMHQYYSKKIAKVNAHFALLDKVRRRISSMEQYSDWIQDTDIWSLRLIYDSIKDLPAGIRNRYAKKYVRIMESFNIQPYMLGEDRKKHEDMLSWGLLDPTSNIQTLKKKIEHEKYELKETLNSKAYMLGHYVTPKRLRLDTKKIYIENFL